MYNYVSIIMDTHMYSVHAALTCGVGHVKMVEASKSPCTISVTLTTEAHEARSKNSKLGLSLQQRDKQVVKVFGVLSAAQ